MGLSGWLKKLFKPYTKLCDRCSELLAPAKGSHFGKRASEASKAIASHGAWCDVPGVPRMSKKAARSCTNAGSAAVGGDTSSGPAYPRKPSTATAKCAPSRRG